MQLKTAMIIAGVAWTAAGTANALATETITYTYDAKGRVTRIVHTGTVNNGVTIQYTHDHADNRTHVTVAGAP